MFSFLIRLVAIVVDFEFCLSKMASNENYEIPDSGAVFTFGRSGFADNQQSHFFIRNDPVIEISCGDEHTAVVCQNGRIFLFGHNDYGQLGLGHTRTVNKPSCLKYLKPFHSTHVACGKGHTIVSTDCGRLFSFGSNSDGQLGTGDLSDKLTPQLVNTKHFGEGRISAISAGCFHSACLTENGDLYIWGSNSDGQCGTEMDTNLLIPTKVEFKNAISTISCGYYHTAFISEGILYSFGEQENGKLGFKKVSNSSNSPEKVELDFQCAQVACGGNHTLVLSDDGKVFSCGSNFSGQLGIGNHSAENYFLAPVKFPRNDVNITHIAAGENHSAFVTEKGELYTCGDGRYGKTCSDGESTNFIIPTLIMLFSQFQCTFVSCGGCQTMVLAKYKANSCDSDNAKIPSLPPLKMNKSLSENETFLKPETRTIENKEEDMPASKRPSVTSDDNNFVSEETKSANVEEIGFSTEDVYVDVNESVVEESKDSEEPTEVHKNVTDYVTAVETAEYVNENETDVIVRKESGIKKLLKVFRKSAIAKQSTKNANGKSNEKIGKAGRQENGNRQTSTTCAII